MNRILVPVDFSDTSKNALRYATQLFNQSTLEITVLNIYGAHSTALMMKSIDSILIKDAEKQLKDLIDDIRKDAPEVSFKTLLAKSYAVSTIAAAGNSGDYDFIVMGTKGVSGLKEVFMGSVAGGVVAKTNIPVIVVPLDYAFNGLKNIVLALGHALPSEASYLDPIQQLVEKYDSALEVLHIGADEIADLENNLGNLASLSPKITQKTGSGDLNAHFNTHLNNNNTDLLCMIRTKKGFFDRLFNGSVTTKQTFHSPIPLLIVHE